MRLAYGYLPSPEPPKLWSTVSLPEVVTREYCSPVVRPPEFPRAVERGADIEEGRLPWVFAVSRATFEAIEHGFRAGRRDRKDRSATATRAAVRAATRGRAVERAVDVDEARVWVCTWPGPRIRYACARALGLQTMRVQHINVAWLAGGGTHYPPLMLVGLPTTKVPSQASRESLTLHTYFRERME